VRDAAEAGLIERVWCLSPDRLARAYAYQVLVPDELDRFGVTVAFTDSPGLAADDPQATLLTQVPGVIAEYEKAKIAEPVGLVLTSAPPVGGFAGDGAAWVARTTRLPPMVLAGAHLHHRRGHQRYRHGTSEETFPLT
jgi:DNA invertase Pin-like site-specific DNA recombinase